jgi:hypothetical protein
MKMCSMCLKIKRTIHFNLYISGSEGTELCHDCEMLVIRENARDAFRERKAAHIDRMETAISAPEREGLDKRGEIRYNV